MAKSGSVSRQGPRSRPTTFRPDSASSFAMMVPVRPAPTIATSTGLSLVAMAAPPVVTAQQDVLRVPVLVHLGDAVDDILDRYRHCVVRHAVLLDMHGVDGGDAREADQLPAGLVAVAAIDRIGEEALQRVREQHVEEELRAHALQFDLAAIQAAQHFILLRCRERAEAVAVLFRAMGVHLPDADAVYLLRRERRLIALLRRAFGPWALAIHLRHRPPAAEQLPVDEIGDAGLLRAGA